MPRLLQIHAEGNAGSGGGIAENIGKLAMKNGWESYIAIGRNIRKSESKLVIIGNLFSQFCHLILSRLFDMHGFGSKYATKKLIRKIDEIRPDIIHLHSLHGYYINIAILFNHLKELQIPVIWTFHDCWPFTGHCSHFYDNGCMKWKSVCHHCPKKKDYPASWLFDRSRQNYFLKKKLFTSVPNMVIVSVSNWLNNLVEMSFFKGMNTQVIHNGIDIELFSPTGKENSIKSKYKIDNCFLILGVAYPWAKGKGLYDIFELSNHLKPDEKIILVGLSDKQLKKLPANIIGVGKIGMGKHDHKHPLVDFYDAADVFLNLSTQETFGLTTVEAMACGTPTIVYNATACPEIIDSDTGIVVGKNDIKGVLEAISTIKRNGKMYYSHQCRNRVLTKFNQTERFQEYLDLYKKSIT
ncbi:MAG: glycosyltransferase [Prolixibacteraceae bacterium]|jgi:glycosyltransferase involved in cell wall biosynthesis|nr:glycosyltransferase [Prolixibacteraceae bacterium]